MCECPCDLLPVPPLLLLLLLLLCSLCVAPLFACVRLGTSATPPPALCDTPSASAGTSAKSRSGADAEARIFFRLYNVRQNIGYTRP